jgi:hypothetical protein
MKRDFELVRKLLLYFEAKSNDKMDSSPTIDGYSDLDIQYHLLLMDEAGLLRCEKEKSTSSDRIIKVYPFSLTWAGHEFLDASRNENIWERAKKMAGDKIGAIPFDVLKALLIHIVKDTLGALNSG